MEYLKGIIDRITFINEENGFSVLKVLVKGSPEPVTAVGNMATANVGAEVSLCGEWRMDAKFGRQFSVSQYTETVPATVAGIEKYLGGGLIKGIGPVFARNIVGKFKELTIQILDDEPDRLLEVEGIGGKRVDMIKRAWQEQKEIKNVMLFLQGHGVSATYAVKIYKTYGDDSITQVRKNPYKLADDIWGIGFRTADRIAEKLGFDLQSEERCRSAIVYMLNEMSNDGHCYAIQDELAKATAQLLDGNEKLSGKAKKTDSTSQVNASGETGNKNITFDLNKAMTSGPDQKKISGIISKMADERFLIKDTDETGKSMIYLPSLYFSELGTARRIKEILSTPSRFSGIDADSLIISIQKLCNITYDEVQIEAIKKAAISKFMVLTGGPGTGKTTTTLAIIRVLQKAGASVLLAAPTGRAAKRMTETTGMEAKTIHRLLEYRPPAGYKRTAENPLLCDVLIIDETSMVDIVLMYNLLKAIPDTTVVLLIGDSDQLPSVGPGNVLRDIIDSGCAEVVRLTRIFRQAMGSNIILNAHRINKGEFPILKSGSDSDFFYIEQEDPEKVVEEIRNLCLHRLPEYFKLDPLNDIQVLCPMQRGHTGAQNLNLVLQEALNPTDISIKYGATIFRQNDKVMQIKNNYDKNVFNGDIGIIIFIDREDRSLVIRFDNTNVEYDSTELDEVVLAYATTVHKSQGSEYKVVVAPFTTQHFMMLQRNLLYTCVTRAKKAIVLIGTKKAIAIAIHNNKSLKRNTRLSERLPTM